MTKIECIVRYLRERMEAIHYVAITEDLKKLYPAMFPRHFSSKNLASILSAEITRRYPARVVRVGNGFYTVPR